MSELIVKPRLLSEPEYRKLPPPKKEAYVKEILRQTLESNSHGVTVSQLSSVLRFDRRIIEKHLQIMLVTNEVYTVKLGSNVIYLPNNRAMHQATSHSARFGDNEYQVYTLRNRLGDFAIIQQRKNDESREISGALMIPLEDYDKFVAYLRKTIVDMEKRGLRT